MCPSGARLRSRRSVAALKPQGFHASLTNPFSATRFLTGRHWRWHFSYWRQVRIHAESHDEDHHSSVGTSGRLDQRARNPVPYSHRSQETECFAVEVTSSAGSERPVSLSPKLFDPSAKA